ncbi:MAG: hypothetical protein WBJ87_07650, partial [Candidatus Hydrothermia bacterium]
IGGQIHAVVTGAYEMRELLKQRGFFFFGPTKEWVKKLPEAVKDVEELGLDYDFLVVGDKVFPDFSWRGLIENNFIEGWSYKDTPTEKIKEIKRNVNISLEQYDKEGYHFDVLTFSYDGKIVYYFYRDNDFFYKTCSKEEYKDFLNQLK